ncbi:MAG: DNA repair protein RecN [Firmicutes bacterium]|nr:DNA repair protein RecN [Bacillota bacterium]
MSGVVLRELRVRDFAIVDEVAVTFADGFNVLTGETGAGKSILIDALSVALGGRAAADQIRQGAEEASVEAVFEIRQEDHPAVAQLRAEGLYEPGEGLVVLGRTLSASGRHLAHVNGRLATARLLREIGSQWVEIHGQHEHQHLFLPARQRDLLDGFAGEAALEARRRVREAFQRWREILAERAQLAGDPRERARQEDLLRFQLSEIDAARLRPGEEEELAARRRILQHAQRLFEVAAGAHQRLAEGGQPGGALADAASAVAEAVRHAAAIDPRLDGVRALLEDAVTLLREAARELRAYRDGLQFEPEELAQIEERWDLISRLKRKYGETVEEILTYRNEVAASLDAYARQEQRARALDAEEAAARADLAAACRELSRLRREAGLRLQEAVGRELEALAFPEAAFRVDVRPRWKDGPDGREPDADASGADDVEFRLAANPGEEPRPLRAVASGGELSRIMLAVCASAAAALDVPVLVFDEIDAGVGGRTAQAVAQRLAALGRHRQVLCVTHLAQIAARADHHLAIRKRLRRARASVAVAGVRGAERAREIARMLSGGDSPAALRHAEELLQNLEST